MNRIWTLRAVTALLWGLAAACAVFWGLRMGSVSAIVAAPDARPAGVGLDGAARQSAIARLLGAQPAAAAAPGPRPADRFALIGLVASTQGGGAALITVDSKPARPYAVGMQIAPGFVLQSLGPREARLGESVEGPVREVLALPQRPVLGITSAPVAAPLPAVPPPAFQPPGAAVLPPASSLTAAPPDRPLSPAFSPALAAGMGAVPALPDAAPASPPDMGGR
jgi:general secretion pathway protein C